MERLGSAESLFQNLRTNNWGLGGYAFLSLRLLEKGLHLRQIAGVLNILILLNDMFIQSRRIQVNIRESYSASVLKPDTRFH